MCTVSFIQNWVLKKVDWFVKGYFGTEISSSDFNSLLFNLLLFALPFFSFSVEVALNIYFLSINNEFFVIFFFPSPFSQF